MADAASLGFHWLYDAGRIADLAQGTPEFRPPDPVDFEGFQGVFVHHTKRAGDLSHYGEQMRVALLSLNACGGRFDIDDYQTRFAATFGPGGSWAGYIDKATKGTLGNIAAGQRDPSGADDDQAPAIAKLPPLIAAQVTDPTTVDQAVMATNANPIAVAFARSAAVLLQSAFEGADVSEALKAGISVADDTVAQVLKHAIDSRETDSVVFAGEVGRACPLPQSLPVIFHISARAKSYQEAVRTNILAGGDSCGRAPVLAALFAAVYGLGPKGVPLDWIARLNELPVLAGEITAFCDVVRTAPATCT